MKALKTLLDDCVSSPSGRERVDATVRSASACARGDASNPNWAEMKQVFLRVSAMISLHRDAGSFALTVPGPISGSQVVGGAGRRPRHILGASPPGHDECSPPSPVGMGPSRGR